MADQPDFSELCAELLWQIQLYTGLNPAACEMLSVEKTERLMDAMAATRAALDTLATPPPELFVVRHYASDDYPSIKGNGFDGLQVGEDREEAEEFIAWVNKHCTLATPPPEPPKPPTDDELDEFVVFWWGSDTDERTVTDVIEGGSMAAFARAALERWGK